MDKKIKILMAAAEAAPFAKVGGLGDVVGSLPLALAKLNCDVRVIIPLYGAIDRKQFKLHLIKKNISVPSARKIKKVNVWQTKFPGSKAIIYFIESDYFKAKEIYKPEGNNAEAFLFFSVAVLTSLPIIKFKPDIIHCHDFHTALIIDMLKITNDSFCEKIKTVYTIHNINYQGASGLEILSTGNLQNNSLSSLSRDMQDGDINFMVQGILNADLVNTVSKTYAKEIATTDYGANLEKVTRLRKIYGILNGLDTKLFDPATDKLIVKKYSVKSLANKIINKLALQKKLGFNEDAKMPLIGMVTRLTWQKGIDLIDEKLLQLPCQFVILGTGVKQYEEQLKNLEKKYPNKIRVKTYFDLQLAQQIYAGSDIFLMPSRFEPCGLGQMIAMRYGTVPVVRATGGLADTVNSKVGFKFKEFSADELNITLQDVLKVFANEKKWKQLQTNCMRQDFSWDKSANEYLRLYRKLLC